MGYPSSRIHYRPFYKMRMVFRRISIFLWTNNLFSDFSGLDLMFAEAHAGGFAPLWAAARGNRSWKVVHRTSKNDVKIENFWKSRKWFRMILGWLCYHILRFGCFSEMHGSKNWCKIWSTILLKHFVKKRWFKNIYDALRVSPAVTRLTVYRRLQVIRGQGGASFRRQVDGQIF